MTFIRKRLANLAATFAAFILAFVVALMFVFQIADAPMVSEMQQTVEVGK